MSDLNISSDPEEENLSSVPKWQENESVNVRFMKWFIKSEFWTIIKICEDLNPVHETVSFLSS